MKALDVSSYQGRVDWGRVAAAGYHLAWVKATEGQSVRDQWFGGNRNNAADHGVRVGAYHFARPELHGPETEAYHFCTAVGTLRRRELRPMLDFEQPTHLSTRQTLRWIQTFNRAVKKELGVWPLFYSYPALVEHLGLPHTVGAGLILASYAANDGREHSFSAPRPWRKAVGHQFTSRGRVPGINGPVDLDDVRSLRAVLAHPWLGLV